MNYAYHLLNPLDYFRLLYSILFDRSQFPDLEERGEQIRLVCQTLLSVLFANILIGLGVTWFRGRVDWKMMAVGVMLSVAVSAVLGVTLGVIDSRDKGVEEGVKDGVAAFAVFGIVFGVTFGTAFGVALGIALGVAVGAIAALMAGIKSSVASDGAFGVAFGVAVGVAVALARADVGAGALAAFIGLWGAATVAVLVQSIWDDLLKLSSMQQDWWSGIFFLVVFSIGMGYLYNSLNNWLPLNAPQPLITAAIFVLAFSRLPVWPLEAAWGLLVCWFFVVTKRDAGQLARSLRWAYFDHAMILPLPGEATILRRLAQLDPDSATFEAIELACSSNHLLTAVSILQQIASHDPLRVHEGIMTIDEHADRQRLLRYVAYQLPPASARAWDAVLCLSEASAKLSPPPAKGRGREPVVRLVSQLLETRTEDASITFPQVLESLRQATHDLQLAVQLESGLANVEPALTMYNTLLLAMKAEQLKEIASYTKPSLPENVPQVFSEELRTTLSELEELAVILRGYLQATSPVTQRNALLQANEKLEAIVEQLDNVPSPTGPLIALAVVRWRQILTAAGGELARGEMPGPVANPYVLGNPVTGDLFVGREDILRRLEELWAPEGQCPSVVLYGHRRMGKSSILHNLGARFGARTVIVDFNMQRVGLVSKTGELLYNLASALYDELHRISPSDLSEPVDEQFTAHNPYTAFDRFLRQLDKARDGRRLIVTVDEFELLETMISEGKLEPRLLDFWRSLIQTYPWFVMAFAGLHTLQEMTHDYWNPLYGSVTAIPVSFLSNAAAWRLITQPTPDFPLDYDADAVNQIIALTHGQPYLMQLVCHGLVTRFNRQIFEDGMERERRFTLADVQKVINAPEFFRDGDAYFTGVWVQAQKTEPPQQTSVLRAIAQAEAGMDIVEITSRASLALEDVHSALETLKRHDVVTEENGRWQFTVELMRRWVAQKDVR